MCIAHASKASFLSLAEGMCLFFAIGREHVLEGGYVCVYERVCALCMPPRPLFFAILERLLFVIRRENVPRFCDWERVCVEGRVCVCS